MLIHLVYDGLRSIRNGSCDVFEYMLRSDKYGLRYNGAINSRRAHDASGDNEQRPRVFWKTSVAAGQLGQRGQRGQLDLQERLTRRSSTIKLKQMGFWPINRISLETPLEAARSCSTAVGCEDWYQALASCSVSIMMMML